MVDDPSTYLHIFDKLCKDAEGDAKVTGLFRFSPKRETGRIRGWIEYIRCSYPTLHCWTTTQPLLYTPKDCTKYVDESCDCYHGYTSDGDRNGENNVCNHCHGKGTIRCLKKYTKHRWTQPEDAQIWLLVTSDGPHKNFRLKKNTRYTIKLYDEILCQRHYNCDEFKHINMNCIGPDEILC